MGNYDVLVTFDINAGGDYRKVYQKMKNLDFINLRKALTETTLVGKFDSDLIKPADIVKKLKNALEDVFSDEGLYGKAVIIYGRMKEIEL